MPLLRNSPPTIVLPFRGAGAVLHAPEVGVGEGACHKTLPLQQPSQGKGCVTIITEVVAPGRGAHGHTYVQGAENHTLCHNVQTNEWSGITAMIANETNLNSTENPKMCCDNRRVEAEREGW